MKRLFAIVLILFGGALPASAQLCLGQGSFREAPLQVQGGIGFTEGAQAFGGGFGGGGRVFFGTGSLAYTNYDDLDAGSVSVGGTAGGEFRGGSQSRVYICPIGAVSFESGPDLFDGAVDTHSLTVGYGGSLGIVASETDTFAVIPTVGAGVRHVRATLSSGTLDETGTDTFGLVTLGVGLLFNRTIALTPTIGIPVGLDEGDPQFSIVLSVNFGRRP